MVDKQNGKTFWITGLSGAGKTTLALALIDGLNNRYGHFKLLDGDNLRLGICNDLGFSLSDRSENVRRVAEIAKLFNESGINVICSLISPLRDHRDLARKIIGNNYFFEIYLSASIEVCAKRDPKLLYRNERRVMSGNFTGISSPYEPPQNPNLKLDTGEIELDVCKQSIVNFVKEILQSEK